MSGDEEDEETMKASPSKYSINKDDDEEDDLDRDEQEEAIDLDNGELKFNMTASRNSSVQKSDSNSKNRSKRYEINDDDENATDL